MVCRLVIDEMDFVHYQPPAERDSKARSEKKTLHQKAARRRSPSGGVKLDGRVTHVSSQGSKARSAGGLEEMETSTRPRLSPEQVWLLERQFQAHSKPSSEMKRQLAEITSLSLPRVAVSLTRHDVCEPVLIKLELVPKSPGQGEASEETRRGRACPRPGSCRTAIPWHIFSGCNISCRLLCHGDSTADDTNTSRADVKKWITRTFSSVRTELFPRKLLINDPSLDRGRVRLCSDDL